MNYIDPYERIARNMRILRKARGLSGGDLARAMTERGFTSWDRALVSKIETRTRKAVSVAELLAMAEVFEVDLTLLLHDKLTVTVTVQT